MTNEFDYPDPPCVRSNGFVESAYKTFDNLWKNKENADAGWLLLPRLDKLTKEKNELCDEINQHLTFINLKKDSSELSNKTKHTS